MRWIAASKTGNANETLKKRLCDAADQGRAHSHLKFQDYSASVLGRILASACGSGCMFVSSTRSVGKPKRNPAPEVVTEGVRKTAEIGLHRLMNLGFTCTQRERPEMLLFQ